MAEKITMWSYLEPFLPLVSTKERIHLAAISKTLKKPHSTVRKHLHFFEKQGILTKTVQGKMTFYGLNSSSPLLIDYLTIAEKESLLRKCKNDLLLNEFVFFLHNNLEESCSAIIFGSAAEGQKKIKDKARDIDLILTGNVHFKEETKQLEKRLNITIHLINVKDLKSIKEGLKKEIAKKHLLIQGSEAVLRWLI